MRNSVGFPLLYIENPLECRIIRRLNRFVVEVSLCGNSFRACINNTGRLPEFLVEGKKGFCTKNEKPGKTDYRLFSVEESGLGALIDVQLQMRAFEKALALGLLPWLKAYKISKRNARLGDSVIDYLLEGNGEEVFLEVKSAALRGGSYAMYPDCVSLRGRRHVKELTRHTLDEGRSVILFIAALPDVKAFTPNKSVDPELQKLLVEARSVGVVIKSIGISYDPKDACIYLYTADLGIDLFNSLSRV